MPSESILTCKNLTMRFGGVVAVENFNIDVEKNKITSLIGPNGAGKTTAFNMITGVYTPSNGEIYFKDKLIAKGETFVKPNGKRYSRAEKKMKPDEICRMGIARTFQNIRLFKNLSVFENVLIALNKDFKSNFFSASFHMNGAEEKALREKAEFYLKEINLYQFKDEKASSLPYGFQRHLEIARSLATNPELLLLDEPAAGLNPKETEELADFIVKIKERFNLTLLIIEHHMSLVMKISDKVYVLDFGKMIADGTPAEIQSNENVIRAYLGSNFRRK